MAKPLALIPLNDLSRAKGRLAELMGPMQRVQLAMATFTHVCIEAERAGLDVAVLAVLAEDVKMFEGAMRILREQPGVSGLSAQLEAALGALDVPEVLILHADLPLASAAELSRLVNEAPPPPSATLVRSADGGTNAMLLRPPGKFALHYGAGSFAKHVDAANRAGVEVSVVESSRLSLDLDTPADIDSFFACPASRGSDMRRIVERVLQGERM